MNEDSAMVIVDMGPACDIGIFRFSANKVGNQFLVAHPAAFYTDAKYWNREYRNAMISMHIGRPIMGQRVVDILTLLDFCSEHEFLKGHPVKVFANGIYGPVAIHAAYLDERINSVEIKHSMKTWKEYIEMPMQWHMYSNVLYGALKYYDLPDLIRLSNCPIRFAD